MCGIAGWIGHVADPRGVAACLGEAVAHRGRDDAGEGHWPDAALIFRRLSIIDLSAAGAQPIANEDGRIAAVFNGEIYNHAEIRRDLQSRGHVFRGRADSEILPHLYEEHGAAMFERLRGMFAIAVFDSRRKKLLLARDRFGVKPLFYAATSGALFFASELNALRLAPGFDSTPDRQAITDFVALTYIPAPRTFYRGARALEPGDLLEIYYAHDEAKSVLRSFHSWSPSLDSGLSVAAAAERAESLINNAVQRQLESDVPVGTLLSGGIDSSLVSAAAARSTAGPLRTFNVRFADAGYDETWAALTVARHIGAEHRTLDMMDGKASWDEALSLLLHAGQPFADSSIFGVSAVSKLMRQHVTVALAGDGGDEAFGGYDTLRRIGLILRWQTVPSPLRGLARIGAGPLARAGYVSAGWPQRMGELGAAGDTRILQTLYSWIRPAEHEALCRLEGVDTPERHFERRWPSGGEPGDRRSRLAAHSTEIDVRLVMANDYLFKVDTASMREGLEIRVPMLDEDLFAFGLSLPPSLRRDGRQGKPVLREVASRWLPQEVASKPKQGFSVPVNRWLGDDFRERFREYVLDRSSPLAEYLRPEVYEPLVSSFAAGKTVPGISRAGLYTRAIVLMSLQAHLTRALDGVAAPVNAPAIHAVAPAPQTKPVRVAIIAGPLGLGGSEQQLVYFLSGIDRRRYAPLVISVGGGPDDAWAAVIAGLGIPLVFVPVAFSRPQRLQRIAALLKTHRADIVHGWLLYTARYAALAGVAAGVPTRIGSVREDRDWKAWQRPLGSLTLLGLDVIVANWAGAERRFPLLPRKRARFELVHNGVSIPEGDAAQTRDHARRELGLPLTGAIIGALGTLDANKNFAMLLHVFSRLEQKWPELRVAIIGDGRERDRLRALALELGVDDRVTFAGARPQAARLLPAFDAVCLTSSREGLPNVLLEAGAAGIPAVATDAGGVKEIVDHGITGYVVPAGDIDTMVTCLDRLLSDPAHAAGLGRAARERIRGRFGIQRMVAEMAAVYDAVP